MALQTGQNLNIIQYQHELQHQHIKNLTQTKNKN